MNVPFAKYHGAGNDFILMKESWMPEGIVLKDLILQICDRHTGIGADGFILVPEDHHEMVYYNQDGSRAPMCGNGIRCYAKFVLDEGLEDASAFDVETLAGTKKITVLSTVPFQVSVNIGKGIFTNESIQVDQEERIWNYPVLLDEEKKELYSFFMSTVHTVVFCSDPAVEREKYGRMLCEMPLFKEQSNINFVNVLDDSHIQVQTYERGCGPTLACGTGVCASVLSAWKTGRCSRHVHAALEKGSLEIEILEDESVCMRGSACRIAKGEFYYDKTA